MSEIIMDVREGAVERLSCTEGEELDITCNLTKPQQIEALMEMFALIQLGSRYMMQRKEMWQRLSCSYNGRHRSDVVEISKTPDRGDTD